MKNIPIFGKFLSIMAVFGVFAVGVAFYAGSRINGVSAAYVDLLDHEANAAVALARANRHVQGMRAAIGDVMLASGPELAEEAFKDYQNAREQFTSYIDKAITLLPGDSSLPALKTEVLQSIDAACQPTFKAGRAAASQEEIIAAQQLFWADCKPVFAKMTPVLAAAVNAAVSSSEVQGRALADSSQSTARMSIISVIFGIAIVLAGGFVAIRAWLVRPIRQLASTMETLAAGNLDTAIDGTDRRDEIGLMARSVGVFKDNGLAARELARDAENARSMTEAERARNIKADQQRAEAMAQATSGLAEGLQQLAGGNLTYKLNQAFAPEFESLRANFNATVEKLQDAMSAVTQSAGAIDSGSREMSDSASNLSKRTEQQAASLEETAAALDQITVNVTNSSKRTDEARVMASEANVSAQRSGEVVASAVDAMNRIEQSSNQITSIIGVIDEIAFQTNLLALNAGVEAARAGEAGKGFAVVAQEVRELAQRSASAAKEIKELIRKSADEVDNGVKLVTATGEVLKIIGDQVVSINAQLDAIATSAREQSVGLKEVNIAVNQMDQVTQQNAAMVEEATAASASLATEAERLRHLMSQFQLGSAVAAINARPVAAHNASRPAASPARALAGRLKSAFSGGASSAAAAKQEWSEF